MRFALAKEGVSCVLVGFSEAAQIDEVVACSGAGPLSENTMERLRSVWDADFS